jgi:hypothetical protein
VDEPEEGDVNGNRDMPTPSRPPRKTTPHRRSAAPSRGPKAAPARAPRGVASKTTRGVKKKSPR